MFTRTVSLRIVEAIEKFSPNLFHCFSVCVPSVTDGGPSVVNTEKNGRNVSGMEAYSNLVDWWLRSLGYSNNREP